MVISMEKQQQQQQQWQPGPTRLLREMKEAIRSEANQNTNNLFDSVSSGFYSFHIKYLLSISDTHIRL